MTVSDGENPDNNPPHIATIRHCGLFIRKCQDYRVLFTNHPDDTPTYSQDLSSCRRCRRRIAPRRTCGKLWLENGHCVKGYLICRRRYRRPTHFFI
ncbi:hypothetical protein Zmor_013367 [Zophobas morio]|uniref:Uncharacterized protein n=1 Tax=Zophobas morio TaxID=2755281 RepID=A0AA38MFG9_9CUCU|nr:hypothetical protein Zmor_013367 [Zophobas morio]